jgi:hypothetical protein
MKDPNHLIHESSPYLLQHAYNPVKWYPWKDEVLEMARKSDKMIIISIGYSACHWCHVMEREVFENEEAAVWMNRNFVCIKVDREERPDVDMVYMKAVQLMNGQGGWPLNCFALPDGRPVYGGTYFPLDNWLGILRNLSEMYLGHRPKMEEYAGKLLQGIRSENMLPRDQSGADEQVLLKQMLDQWKPRFDVEKGGPNRAPKFPLPDNYLFLLRYATLTSDEDLLHHVHLTLRSMCRGGIYDQLGGGFSRYSTDMDWHVPHFEKMLYDNALLIQLYAEAYRAHPDAEYASVVEESIAFCNRELKDASGLYYSALDADSEGEEGRYYVWTHQEIDALCGEDSELIAKYFNVSSVGNWEHGKNILFRRMNLDEFAADVNLDATQLRTILHHNVDKLLKAREKRVRPGLDDKCLTAWNAMMVSGLCSAYLALGKKEFLQKAIAVQAAINKHLLQPDFSLLHTYKAGKASIAGFLDDYAFVLRGLLDLYYASGDDAYLLQGKSMADLVFTLFDDGKEPLFLFKSTSDAPLIAEGKEWQDNVTPSSNAVLAKVLHELGLLLDRADWMQRAGDQLASIRGGMVNYGSAYSHWAQFMLERCFPFHQFVLAGDEALEQFEEYRKGYYPNHILLLKRKGGNSIKFLDGKDSGIYVCIDQTCSLPLKKWEEVKKEFFIEN